MLRLFFLTLLLVALGGCATLQDEQPVTDQSHERWEQRQLRLDTLEQWHLRGRVALFVKEEVYNLGLDWQRDGDISTLKLEAALGQGMVQLSRQQGEIELKTSEGERFYGDNAEQVLYAATGWALPVEGLQSWIKGINHEQSDYIPDIDSQGRAKSLQQDGWRINYLSYQKITLRGFGRAELPQKMYLKRGQLALKIVIDQWQSEATDASNDDLFPEFPK
jgi:outer membrane lipoprotein LolB